MSAGSGEEQLPNDATQACISQMGHMVSDSVASFAHALPSCADLSTLLTAPQVSRCDYGHQYKNSNAGSAR